MALLYMCCYPSPKRIGLYNIYSSFTLFIKYVHVYPTSLKDSVVHIVLLETERKVWVGK